jgi:hypothetical protein
MVLTGPQWYPAVEWCPRTSEWLVRRQAVNDVSFFSNKVGSIAGLTTRRAAGRNRAREAIDEGDGDDEKRGKEMEEREMDRV